MDVGGSEAAKKSRCELIKSRCFHEPRGSLCVAQVGEEVSFTFERAFWIFDVPLGEVRACHAHREQHELMVAVKGKFAIHCDDGHVQTDYELGAPDTMLLVPPMVFHHLDGFSDDAVCFVLSSGPYDWSELVHDYGEFCELSARFE